MLITVPGEKELYNYDGRYGYYRGVATDFVLLQTSCSEVWAWWSSIYEKDGNYYDIEIYSWLESVYGYFKEKGFIEQTIKAKQGMEYEVGIGIRPLIKDLNNALDEKKIISKEYYKYDNRDCTRYEIEYGEYPSNVADSTIATELEYHFYNKELTKTGKEYTYLILNNVKKLEEYIYKGKKYVRIVCEVESKYNRYLSNHKKINKGEIYWIEVTPIKWILSDMSYDVLSKDVICYVPTYATKSCFNCFYATDIYKFLNSTFKKDIIPSKVSDNYYSREEVPDTKIIELEKLLKEINKKINNLNNILRKLYKLTYEIENIKVNDRKIERYKLKKRKW